MAVDLKQLSNLTKVYKKAFGGRTSSTLSFIKSNQDEEYWGNNQHNVQSPLYDTFTGNGDFLLIGYLQSLAPTSSAQTINVASIDKILPSYSFLLKEAGINSGLQGLYVGQSFESNLPYYFIGSTIFFADTQV